MQEPIETIIIGAHQNLEVVGGLNPVQIEIEDDRVVNMLKKHKNIIHKLIPLKILFPGSTKTIQNRYLLHLQNLTMSKNL